MDIEELENSIRYYSTKYYEGEPVVTDEVFDSLVDKLRTLKPDSEVLKTGWGFEVNGAKVKHKYSHIGSLDKTKTFEDIPDRFKNKTIYISPKLDGLSAVVYYQNGTLIKAVTRGNGEYGKDITNKLKIILGPTISDRKFTGAVRGELIISNTNWNKLQNKYTNLIAPRNFAAGIINRKDIDEDIQYIDLVVYKIIGQENTPILEDRESILHWLQLNFTHCIPICYYPTLNKQCWETYHTETFNKFEQLGYGLDGLVLDSSNVLYDNSTMSYNYDEVAFKFKAETTETTIKNIEWTLSKSQRLVPVAVVEPVELSGAIINRATCNNAQMVKDLGLGVGSTIEITRSNEVIPCIVNVIEESTQPLPDKCPICGSQLQWVGVDLKCVNNQCPNIELSNLQQWCESIGETDGLQWTLMKQYLDLYKIGNISDLYTNKDIVLKDLSSKRLTITEEKIYEFFKKLYIEPVPIYKALLALNIPRLGEKTCKVLAKEKQLILGYYSYLLDYSHGIYTDVTPYYNKFIEVVKQATQMSIWQNSIRFLNLRYLFQDARVIFEDTVDNVSIKYIGVTGSLETMKRKDFENYINKYGYELTTNIKKCCCLVANNSSTSSKYKEAQKYNIPIITEKEFLQKLV